MDSSPRHSSLFLSIQSHGQYGRISFRYLNLLSLRAQRCTICNAGSYSAASDSSSCTSCLTGYTSFAGSTACARTFCPAGTFFPGSSINEIYFAYYTPGISSAQGDANTYCQTFGGVVASYVQVQSAFNAGADWCAWGWVNDQPSVYSVGENNVEAWIHHQCIAYSNLPSGMYN